MHSRCRFLGWKWCSDINSDWCLALLSHAWHLQSVKVIVKRNCEPEVTGIVVQACHWTIETQCHWVVLNLIQYGGFTVEHSSSVVECWTRNRESPGSIPPFATTSNFEHFHSLHDAPTQLHKWVPGYRQWWKCEWIVVTRNCCMARMLPREVKLVWEMGMNGSALRGWSGPTDGILRYI